jgi:hypothetical protein
MLHTFFSMRGTVPAAALAQRQVRVFMASI